MATALNLACGGGDDGGDGSTADGGATSGEATSGPDGDGTQDGASTDGDGSTPGDTGDTGASTGATSGDTGDGSGTSGGSSGPGTSGSADLPPSIGLVQYDADAHFGDYDFNIASMTDWALQAIDRGARIIVLPEGSSYGYASTTEVWCSPGRTSWYGKSCRDVSTVAETLPGGPTTAYWDTFAREHGVYVVYHVPEVDGGTYYTSLGVVGPDGWVTRYRKRSLYYVDQAFASEGGESVVLETPWGDFGLMLCLDGTYNEPYYAPYKAAGVDGVIISMDWDEDPYGASAAITWFADRARDNDVEIYAADVSTWDGTAKYLPGGVPRERNGLAPVAVGIDGISVHALTP